MIDLRNQHREALRKTNLDEEACQGITYQELSIQEPHPYLQKD
jgi:hypothetical protein